MKKITLFIALLISSLGFSQTYDLLASLNGTNLEGVFGGTTAVYVTDPVGGSDQVVRITSNPGENWQGVNIDNFTSTFSLTSATQLTMQLDVYSTTAITIAPKAQGGVSGAPQSVTTASHTGSGMWETLTFTFNQSLDGKVPANGVYADFALHINWNTVANTFGAPDGRIFYIKNLKGLSAAPPADPAPTTAAPTPPARVAADVVSIYSDAYAVIPAINLDQGWCGSPAIVAATAGGNAVLAYKNQNCQGIDFDANRQDLTGFTHIHVDLFIAAGTDLVGKVFNIKTVPGTGAESEFNIDINALSPAPVPGTWYSYDKAITFTGPTTATRQVGVTSNLQNAVWYDNLYFHKNTTLGTKDFKIAGLNVSPNPSKNSWTVKTSNINMSAITVYDILGKNVLSLSPNASEASINGSSLKAGLYFAQIKTANGVSSIKLVKE